MTMDQLKPGQSAYILSIGGSGALRHHLLDMGLTPQTEVTLQKIAPMGDPVQIKLRGYELTLRLDEAQKITVEQVHEKKLCHTANSGERLWLIREWVSLAGSEATTSTILRTKFQKEQISGLLWPEIKIAEKLRCLTNSPAQISMLGTSLV